MVSRGRTTMWKLAAFTGLVAVAACSADSEDTVPAGVERAAPAEEADSHTEAIDGLVIVTKEDDDGTRQVQLWNDAQTRLLFQMAYQSSQAQYTFHHVRLDTVGYYPLNGGETPSWELLREQTLALYGMMGGDEGEQAYDGFGCDGAAGKLSCTLKGGCCDSHDYCYGQNGCTANSWGCSPSSCASPWLGLHAATAYMLCSAGGAIAADCTTNPNDNTSRCAGCNRDAVSCILSPFSWPGKSSCCGKASGDGGCGDDRDGCETQPDGTCPDPDDPPPPDPPPPEPPEPPPSNPPNGPPGGGTPCSKGTGCSPRPPGPVDDPWPGGGHTGGSTTSASPEKKYGPAPDGDPVAADIPWSYQIDFWNAAQALAPVQELVVVDYLDPSFDWTSVDFGFVEYADRIVSVEEGVTTFTLRDYPPLDGCVMTGTPEEQFAVDIELTFNAQTGRIELRLRVIDTATGSWPMDPYAGILPPPDEEVCGRGSLTFTVRPLASLELGSVIRNTASVIFDTNPANNTNEVWNVIGP